MSHTPGPWDIADFYKCVGPDNDILSLRVAHETGGAIADVYANCLVKTDAECEANARLIAAAPDLLAALERAKLMLTVGMPEYDATDVLEIINEVLKPIHGN